MRICLDLDGVICKLRQPNESYGDLKPVPGAIEWMTQLKAEGHTLIIYTARNSKTQGGNLGKILKNQGLVTLNWLEQYKVPYDEIHFGKPHADIYIDDNAFRFESWEKIGSGTQNFPKNREAALIESHMEANP